MLISVRWSGKVKFFVDSAGLLQNNHFFIIHIPKGIKASLQIKQWKIFTLLRYKWIYTKYTITLHTTEFLVFTMIGILS